MAGPKITNRKGDFLAAGDVTERENNLVPANATTNNDKEKSPLAASDSTMQDVELRTYPTQLNQHSYEEADTGTKLANGRFTLVKNLGRGSMGEVWLAEDAVLQQRVALKRLPPELSGDIVGMETLRQEASKSQRLAHPSIVRVNDLHYDNTGAFISMEFVDGQSGVVWRLAQQQSVATWAALTPLVTQLLDALEYAHGEGVIHREIKPSNILVDARGRAKLLDFGIAATLSHTMNHASLQHVRAGTPNYMSPQQLEGRLPKPTDDIYALGATLYEFLTGKPPFHSGDIPSQLAHVAPTPLADRMKELGVTNPVPPNVAEAILACLAKNPEERPQTATDLSRRLGLSAPTAVVSAAIKSPGARVKAALGVVLDHLFEWCKSVHESVFSVRRLSRRWPAGAAGAGLTVAFGLALLLTGNGDAFERVSYDVLSRWHVPPKPTEAVVVTLNDEAGKILKQPANRPWDRQLHAQLINRLNYGGAKLIVFDIIFDEPGPDTMAGRAADVALAQAIRSQTNVVLCGEHLSESEPGKGWSYQTNAPYEPFRLAARSWGFSLLPEDADVGIRQHGPTLETAPPLALAAALAHGSPAAKAAQRDSTPRWVRYYGSSHTIPQVSYDQALLNGAPTNFFRDKVVFIGAQQNTGFVGSAKDSSLTPFSSASKTLTSRVEIQATIFLNLIKGDWLVRLPGALEVTLVVVFGLFVGWTLTMLRMWSAMIVGLMLAGVVVAGALGLFRWQQAWFPWTILIAQAGLALASSFIFNSFHSLIETRLLERSLAMHLPPKRVKQILSSPDTLKPGAERVEITIMFSDILGFSTIADRTLSDKLYQRLNAYFGDLIQCIHDHDGTVIKLLGDGAFAIWNAPEPQPNAQELACKAAIAIRDRLPDSLSTKVGFRFETRIGLHFGAASVGNLGSAERIDYTAIGTNVNVASRMEQLNKHLGTMILASESVVSEVEDTIETRLVGFFKLKGLDRVMEVYEVIGPRGSKTQTFWVDAFDDALKQFRLQHWEAAEAGFKRVLELRGKDGPSSFYLTRLQQFRAQPPAKDWIGEITMDEK
ncbi:MAG: CHASE2 domain-containing protein [Gammaproteobacteria bacterium]|nr:CHASE2 domain-containing protein [Gammaproteobacteria bacterium]